MECRLVGQTRMEMNHVNGKTVQMQLGWRAAWTSVAVALALFAAACADATTDPTSAESLVDRTVEATQENLETGATTTTTEVELSEAPSVNDGEPNTEPERNDDVSTEEEPGPVLIGRADVAASGNRVAAGRGSLTTAEPIDIELPGAPIWILPVLDGEDSRFFVEIDDGQTFLVDTDGRIETDIDVATATPAWSEFTDPLPDGRIVELDGTAATLVEPTDRYPHGVLGDRIEAAAIEVVDVATGERTRFGPESPTVIEGISPVLADITGDGQIEVLVTHSNAEVGAWLAVWSTEGTLLAESAPIGRGNRWRNQLAVAPIGPAGELEVIDVQTPHIDGITQFFRVGGDQLNRVTFQTGFTSHVIGSRNLDLGIVVDADGDDTLEVVLPTDDLSALGILRRVEAEAGVEVVDTIALPGQLTTNIAVSPPLANGAVSLAAGTADNVLRIWPGS